MKVRIDRNSYKPIYLHIRDHLREMISEHTDYDKPFYSENELSEMFDVSRLTVRRAVQELVDSGVLYRVKGLGTFIRKRSEIEGEIIYSKGYIAQWRLQGKDVNAKVVKIKRQLARPIIIHNLGLESKTEVIAIERIRYANGSPIIVDDIYLPHLEINDNQIKSLEYSTVQSLLTDAIGIKPAMALIEIAAIEAGRREQEYLNLDPGAPLLKRTLILLAKSGEALSYGESFHHPDMFTYRLRIPVDEGSS